MTYAIGEPDLSILLPDPVPPAVRRAIISVDDHLVEPPGMFDGRLPATLQERAPQLVVDERGRQVWTFDGQVFTQVGMNAVVGRRPETRSLEPARFEEMRRGCWDVDDRVRDMDMIGCWASLCFPSQIAGFAGRVFSACSEPELGLAVTQAWNDWLHDEWVGAHPDRFIACGITYLADPELAATEIRRNAARGFVSVTLPERPHNVGLPSLFSGWWDPVVAACVETGTVISLHVGSSGMYPMPDGAPALQLGATLFGQLSLNACAEWLWSGYALRHPELRIAMSEGGIGWVPMLVDRLDNLVDRSGYGLGWELRPAEVLRRNFWFCTIDDPSTIDLYATIGEDHVMVEVDYPHGDSTWPDTQDVIERAWGHLPERVLDRLCCENAAALYRHPLPPPGWLGSSATVPA
ncbi:MAG: amidohydrolase family protein [Acidimicrobiia bacterium]